MRIGKLILKRVSDSKVIKYYHYEHLALDTQSKKDLKIHFLDTGEYILLCGCDNEIEMKIDKDFKRIYPAKRGIKHKNRCPRSRVENTIYNQAWNVDESTGETSVRVNFSLDPTKLNKEEIDTSSLDNISNNKKTCAKGRNCQVNGKTTVSALVKNLNTQTWKRRAFKEQSFSDKFNFWKTLCYGESNTINLNVGAIVNKKKTKNLREMMFEPYKAMDIVDKESRFAYMYLSDLRDMNNGNFELTCIYQKANSDLSTYRFIVNNDKLYDSLNSSNLNIDTILNQDVIVSGFVFRNKFNRIDFLRYA